jgi:GWxTD domain-containing protein
MRKLLLFVAFFSNFLLPQTTKNNPSGYLPKFYYDVINYKSETPNKTKLTVILQIPFSNLQFIKDGNKFAAKYRITFTVRSKDDYKVLYEKSWSEKVYVDDFVLTNSKSNYSFSYKNIEFAPGVYSLKCEVFDLESQKSYAYEDLFTVRSYDDKFGISDLLFIKTDTIIDSKKQLIPNISRNMANIKDGLKVYFELYSPEEKEAYLEFSLFNNKNEMIFNRVELIDLKNDNYKQYSMLKSPELSLGEYNLEVALKDYQHKILARTSKKIVSRWIGLPTAVADLNKAVEQMVYIATSSELSFIKNAADDNEKLKRFIEFWKKKDPTPDTDDNPVFEEYYRRVAYANEKFKFYNEGWRSDMGMIYITLGPPSNIERYPFNYDSKPYEVWDYYDLNQRFIFVDQTGFGDYRLLNPVFGSWYRYRQ